MIYLDTNILIWLASGNLQRISAKAVKAIETSNSLLISPIVGLELQYLYEIHKISQQAGVILDHLARAIGLKQCELEFPKIIINAMQCQWTRDPFDRIITAQAAHHKAALITSDQQISQHYSRVVW